MCITHKNDPNFDSLAVTIAGMVHVDGVAMAAALK